MVFVVLFFTIVSMGASSASPSRSKTAGWFCTGHCTRKCRPTRPSLVAIPTVASTWTGPTVKMIVTRLKPCGLGLVSSAHLLSSALLALASSATMLNSLLPRPLASLSLIASPVLLCVLPSRASFSPPAFARWCPGYPRCCPDRQRGTTFCLSPMSASVIKEY